MADIADIRVLRDTTGAPLSLCREVLEEAGGNVYRAREILRERGAEIVEKKASRETREGIIEAYVHANAKIGALLELRCETDFVSRNEEFRTLAHDLVLQIAATDPAVVPENDVRALLEQPYIKDPNTTVGDRMKETIAKVKENIKLVRFTRYQLS
ncbi:MAG: elongation factor Ts [Parcubacteria group bacterium]|nr:elongation factor Ts [Parcubacteria group bacterium]